MTKRRSNYKSQARLMPECLQYRMLQYHQPILAYSVLVA